VGGLGECVDASLKRRRVRLLVAIVLVGTVAAIAFHYAMGFYLGRGYPESTFLFLPPDHFNDWDNPYLYAQAFLGRQPAPFVYFPLGFSLAAVATLLPLRVGFAVVIAVFLVALGWLLGRTVVNAERHALTKLQYAFILIALSYPVLFALDRTNLELVIFVLLGGFFLFLYVRPIWWLAALFLAAAIAFKLYPATLLVLLIAERRLKTFVLALVLTAVLTVAATGGLAAASGYGFADVWHMSMAEKTVNQSNMVLDAGGLQHGHSLWGLLVLTSWCRHAAMRGWETQAYTLVTGVLFVLLALYVVLRETERWKRVSALIIASLLLPFVSADYTLIQMYFPIAFFINSSRASRFDAVYMVLFAILLVPVDYYYFRSPRDVSISVAVYPLAMIALVLLAVRDRAPGVELAERSAEELA
jgi:hypothetical protein